MGIYIAKVRRIKGMNYREIHKNARYFYSELCNHTKRKPYVRSAYFKKEKIFLDLFWNHLYEKNQWDRARRMKFLSCAVELIKNSTLNPISIRNPNKSSEILHRFKGKTLLGELFVVQIKENNNSKKKWLTSVFPIA